MEFFEALRRRRTTNGSFLPMPVSAKHQRLPMGAATMAPSHFNTQPWRYVLVDDEGIIGEIARIGGESVRRLMEEGTFCRRYRQYFRFSERKMEEKRDGIHLDQVPRTLKPFGRQIFSERGQAIINRFGVPETLVEDNRKTAGEREGACR